MFYVSKNVKAKINILITLEQKKNLEKKIKEVNTDWKFRKC